MKRKQAQKSKPTTPQALALAAGALSLAAPVLTQSADPNASSNTATAVTIYSSVQPGAIPPEVFRTGGNWQAVPGYAMVRQERSIDLKKGRNTIRFTDVAALIDPTTVSFASLTDPDGTRVAEQNFQFDLVSNDKLMQKFIDRDIAVEQTHGNEVETSKGKLLSTQGGLVLQNTDGSVDLIQSYSRVKLPTLPGGLLTRPTLVWDILAKKDGAQRARVAYQTQGMSWWADYNLIFTEAAGKDVDQCKLDVTAWVSILNQSGATYADTKLKLIAGDVQRAEPAMKGRMLMRAEAADAVAAAPAPEFQEKAFFEYHLYTLSQPTTLPDNSTKQIELFPKASGVDCDKLMVYDGLGQGYGFYGGVNQDQSFGTQSNKKVDVFLAFKNAKQNNMGMPLPKGRVRVSKLDDADKTLEFVGEDVIDHTPRDENIRIKLGSAFDVVGERRQIDYKIDTKRRVIEEEFEIKVRNQKDEAAKVLVAEHLFRWTNWQILTKSHDFEKKDAHTIHFPLRLAKGQEGVVRYRVRYTW
jgi:hypothetical protein